MTYYEQGFLTKCAERGLTEKQALSFLELANTIANNPYYSAAAGAGAGSLVGGLGGAMIPGKDKQGRTHRLRNALIGALIGGAAGGGLGVGGHFINKAVKNRKDKAPSAPETGSMPKKGPKATGEAAENEAKRVGAISPDGRALTQDEFARNGKTDAELDAEAKMYMGG